MGDLDGGWVGARRLDPEVSPGCSELGGLVTVAEQAVVADATEAPWQDVEDEAAEKIGRL